MGTNEKKSQGDYEVGYKKPPKDTQFKPGQRANPKGRPRGSRNVKTILRRLVNSKVVLRRGEEEGRLVPAIEAVGELVKHRALDGQDKYIGRFIQLAKMSAIDDHVAPVAKSNEPAAGNSVPLSDMLVDGVDLNLLSRSELTDLSRILDRVQTGGGIAALSDGDSARLRELLRKGLGLDVPPSDGGEQDEAA